MGRRQFTLVELMIVIAIISVIAALAIPDLIESRRRATEASALTSLKALYVEQEAHRKKVGFFGNVNQLQAGGHLDGFPVTQIVNANVFRAFSYRYHIHTNILRTPSGGTAVVNGVPYVQYATTATSDAADPTEWWFVFARSGNPLDELQSTMTYYMDRTGKINFTPKWYSTGVAKNRWCAGPRNPTMQ